MASSYLESSSRRIILKYGMQPQPSLIDLVLPTLSQQNVTYYGLTRGITSDLSCKFTFF